jgi:hypothetical protein
LRKVVTIKMELTSPYNERPTWSSIRLESNVNFSKTKIISWRSIYMTIGEELSICRIYPILKNSKHKGQPPYPRCDTE